MYSLVDAEELKMLPASYVLYFYATWMPKSIAVPFYRMVDRVVSENGGTAVAIDVEAFKPLVKVYDVTRVPTAILYKEGLVVKRLEGHMLTSAFRAAIREVYGDDISKNERVQYDEKRCKDTGADSTGSAASTGSDSSAGSGTDK